MKFLRKSTDIQRKDGTTIHYVSKRKEIEDRKLRKKGLIR